MWKLVLLPLALAALLLGACGDDDDATEDDNGDQVSAEENLCTSLGAYYDSVVALDSLDPSSASKDDYEAAVADVNDSWAQVQEDAADVTTADITTLDSAYDDLNGAIEDVPDDEPVEDALGTLSEEVTAVKDAYEEVNNGLSCP